MAPPATPEARVVGKVVPPSVLSRMRKVCPAPRVWFQVIVRREPRPQRTPLVGDVMLTVPEIVKLTLLVSLTAAFAEALTRTRAWVVTGPETTQL